MPVGTGVCHIHKLKMILITRNFSLTISISHQSSHPTARSPGAPRILRSSRPPQRCRRGSLPAPPLRRAQARPYRPACLPRQHRHPRRPPPSRQHRPRWQLLRLLPRWSCRHLRPRCHPPVWSWTDRPLRWSSRAFRYEGW